MHTLLLICWLPFVAKDSIAPTFDVQGHRGCRGLMPENTIPAFLKALDLGVTTLELDVVISQDKQVVVSHEPYFRAPYTTAPDGNPVRRNERNRLLLYRLTYDQIRHFDVGLAGNPAFPEQEKIKTSKPRLRDVIEQAEAYRRSRRLPAFTYSIEIKSSPSAYGVSQPAPAEFCDLVQSVIRSFITNPPTDSSMLSPNRFIIQSFDVHVLQHWHQQVMNHQYLDLQLSLLINNLRSYEKNLRRLGFTPAIYSPDYRLLNRKTINRLHQKGIRVIPWTVNRRAHMERLKMWGADGLITDYPDRARGL